MRRSYKIIAFMLIFVILQVFGLYGCSKNEETEKEFMEIVTETKSYKLEGMMESFYLNGRKQNEFCVLYKSENEIKVTLSNPDSEDSQIILKNKDGIHILIPTVNKNFKIQSAWPTNASYPYLLQSLAKDIANEENPVITESDTTKSIETKTYLYKDAVANKQKIIFNKETNLPIEVLIYDKQGEVYIRVVFTSIDLNATIDEKEFLIDATMTTMRSELEESVEYKDRMIKYPVYCPEGCKLKNEKTVASTDGLDIVSIMTYEGTYDFTIVQEYINDKETMNYALENGEIIFVLGVPTIIKDYSVQTIYEGVEYTIASSTLPMEEILTILESYMMDQKEK